MPKRLTDTEIWGKPYFRKAPGRIKLLWKFLNDNCDIAGMWDGDFDSASFHIGESVSAKDFEDFPEIFKDRIEAQSNGKWFLPTFVTFQYRHLSVSSTPQLAVIRLLEKHGFLERYKNMIKGYETLTQGFSKPLESPKDRIKTGQGQDKDRTDGKRLYGSYVWLKDEEVKKLVAKAGKQRAQAAIEKLDNYLGQNEKNLTKYTSHYRAILNWVLPEIALMEKKGILHFTPEEKNWQCRYCGATMPESKQYGHNCPKAPPADPARVHELIEDLKKRMSVGTKP